MKSSDIIQAPTLQRLEELSQFRSCIKNFGRSILPPVLLVEHKNEILHIRAEAINKEADLAKRRKERLNLSEKVRAVFEKIEKTQCSSLSGNDVSPNSTNYQRVENEFPPFPQSPHLKSLNASHSGINDSFAVHKITTSDSYEQLLQEHASSCKLEEKVNNDVVAPDSDSFDDHYCKDGNVSEVSDDEVSVIDETDCGSLPTVIFAAKQQAFSQDTDCESIATSVGQSTDLEKYLDCSMETSNASDSCTTVSEARDSSQLYCASDDLSSNTAVNTESEITPTESAMAEYDEETYGSLKEDEVNVCDDGETHQNEFGSKRADSVDSYLGILRQSAGQLYGQKSLSDQNIYSPNLLDSATNEDIFYDEFEDSKITVVDNRPAVDIESQQDIIDCSQNQLAFDGIDERQTFMPSLIRRNSYTLDEPSDALVQAHANCSCSLTSSKCSSPHSVPIRSNSVPAMSKSNAAFVKEKVTVTPLQLTSKYKCVFELDGSSKICNTFGFEPGTSSSVPEKECQAISFEPRAASSEVASSEPHDCYAESSSGGQNEVAEELAERIEDMYSFSPMISEPTVDKSILDQIYFEIQETQKIKVDKLLEEQHQQWMKLQMEFKQQEKVFCEKVERMCTPTFQDFPPTNSSQVDAPHSTSKDVKDNENQNMKLRENLVAIESPIDLNSNQEEILRTCDIHFSIDDSQIKNVVSSISIPVDQNDDTKGLMNENNVSLNSNLREGYNINAASSNNLSEDQIQTQELIESYKKLSFHNSKTTSNQIVLDNITIRPNTSWKTQSLNISSDTARVVNQNNCKNMLEQRILSPPLQSFDEFCNISQRENVTNVHNKNNIFIEGNNMSRVEKDVDIIKRQVQLMPVTVALSCIQASKFAVPSKLSSQKCHLLNVCLNDPVLRKKFEKVSAAVKGYLTRRLFRTEKVQGLIKMLKDTVILLKKMDDDIDTKMKNITNNANLHSQLNITEHDVEFHRQLIVQLTTIFEQIYGIFCEISIKERMKIIAESRQLSRGGHIQAKVVTQISPSLHIISVIPPIPAVHPKPKLSAATIKVLERKKIRSSLENRTYTIDDFRSKVSLSRARSSTLSKSHSLSPTSVYKTSASVINKRKLTSTTKSSTARHIFK